MKTISQMILTTLQNRGYNPTKTAEENETVIRCIINVSAVTFLLDAKHGMVEFRNSHDLIPKATEKMLEHFETLLEAEDTPFTDVVYEEPRNERLLLLAGRVEKDEFSADTVNAIADAVERRGGIVAMLKEMSHTNKEYRSAEDLSEAKSILDRTVEFFEAKGYKARFYDDNTLQVDCEIGGGSLSVTCEGTEYTFGIDCVYFTDEPISEDDAERLVELFETDGAPFENLFFLDDSINIEAEYPYSEFSPQLLEDIIEFLTRQSGFAEAARKLSE